MKAYVDTLTGRIARLVVDGQEDAEPARAGHEWKDWPGGLDPGGLHWPAGSLAPVPDPAVQLATARAAALERIDAIREAREMSALTEGSAKSLAYMHKAAEVRDYRSLASTAAGILAAIGGMTQAQRRSRFPMIQAEVEASGDSFAMVVGRIESAADAGSWGLARIEAKAVGLKRAVRAAANLGALQSIDVEAGWPAP